MPVGSIRPDPYLQQLLHLLAELGAGEEQIREALDIYSHRPAGSPAQPAPTIPLTGNNCAETTGRVSLGPKNMGPKNKRKRKMPKNSTQKGCLQRHGKMWRVILRENYSRPDGTVGRKLVPHPVGRIDEI